MFSNLARAFFGSHNDREIKGLHKQVQAINALESTMQALSDDALKNQTTLFRDRLARGEKLDQLLPEAFATVREAAKRTLGQRHFDVQLMGGMALHKGKIAEMRTGEGKTLVATLPVYLNALTGKGVHVVTVNDYLAKRDSAWMGKVYQFLGLTVGTIVHGLSDGDRRAAYAADVTYGTNNEFGFDYLRDNMKFHAVDVVQRAFNFAIVDEVDSILIDEARTPLIISGQAENSSELYQKVNGLIPHLADTDFEKDEKFRSVILTDSGIEKIEALAAEAGLIGAGTSLYDPHNISVVHHVNQALRAHKLFSRDTDYIVRHNKVVIIDEFTGRMMEGRRFSEGLHQALEAKEIVPIQPENQTMASITFQNYFRLYPKLAGMTGTASTEAAEFAEIYHLDVLEMPTNVAVARVDDDDEIYGTLNEKNDAIVKQIEECRSRQQPVLVGTVSIEKSEALSDLLKQRNIPHQVLNARHHEQEALIIANAGQPGAVTIATNMAGRGTDIQLGGNLEMRVAQELKDVTDEAEKAARRQTIESDVLAARQQVKSAGGLFVIGTERHESRRIDNQLRGRSGRQGDPGHSKFFLSLEDDLLRIFGGDRFKTIMVKLGLRDGEKIVHPLITRAIEHAQRKVEARNFDIRKNLLKYDNIMNDQRKVVYEQRRDIMAAPDVHDMVEDMRAGLLDKMVSAAIPAHSYPEQWQLADLQEQIQEIFGLQAPVVAWGKEDNMAEAEIYDRLSKLASETLEQKRAGMGEAVFAQFERAALLGSLDAHWKDHLQQLDQLRQGIHLRGYAQRDPFNEYTREAFLLFQGMMDAIRRDVTRVVMRANISIPTLDELAERQQRLKMMELHAPAPDNDETTLLPTPQPRHNADIQNFPAVPRLMAFDANNPATWTRTPRNSPCPCGSGKKYKYCHGSLS